MDMHYIKKSEKDRILTLVNVVDGHMFAMNLVAEDIEKLKSLLQKVCEVDDLYAADDEPVECHV